MYVQKRLKACFPPDDAYAKSEDLAEIIFSDKVLKDRAYEMATKPKYNWYQRGLAGMVFNFFDKKTGSGVNVNENLAHVLH